MRILAITIQNFRKLLQCHIEFSEKTTLFVGANNSGKTSAMDALGKFLADRNFNFTYIDEGLAWLQTYLDPEE